MSYRIVALVNIGLLTPTLSYADAGLPMLAVVWPLSWFAFVPIVAIEAIVARRLVQLSWRKSATSSLMANIASTLAGIPITWGFLLVVELIVSQGGRAFGLKTTFTKVLAVTLQAPWLIPYEEDLYWMIPAATAFLLPFFWVASVFIERPIFRKWSNCDKAMAKSWSWKANTLTYGFSIIIVLVWLAVKVVVRG